MDEKSKSNVKLCVSHIQSIYLLPGNKLKTKLGFYRVFDGGNRW